MIVFFVLLMLIGFAVIIKSGNWFVDAAVWFAEVTGLPRLLIGATIVSLATTMPEYFVSVLAVARSAHDFAISNALGSILSNTGLIMSLSLIASPRSIGNRFFYQKAFIMLLSLAFLFIFLLDRKLSVAESVALFAILAYFSYINIKYASKSNGNVLTAYEKHQKNKKIRSGLLKNIAKFVFGAAGIILGARFLVDNGLRIALALNVNETVISITLVAFGTSLPELVTTLTAIAKKETSMGIGNILGANILNLTLLTGSCAVVSGGLYISAEYESVLNRIMPRSLYIDIPFTALLFLLLILPCVLSKGRVYRFQGILMLALYVAFIAFVILNQ